MEDRIKEILANKRQEKADLSNQLGMGKENEAEIWQNWIKVKAQIDILNFLLT